MIDLQSCAVRELDVNGTAYSYCSLPAAAVADPALSGLTRLPYSLRILAENLLRHADAPDVEPEMLAALARGERGFEIPFRPARVLLQDMLGVPVMVDLAGLRDAVAAAGGAPLVVNPKIPVDFVIDHSLIADVAGTPDAARRNTGIEYARNRERFAFLAWCQGAFRNFRVVPPDSGIVHQINVERLAQVVWTAEADGDRLVYPDTLVCNDSHTPMVNGIGVLGWGVGGIEAEAAMLGRALMLRVPEVLGVRVTGELPPGATATDLVLTITEQALGFHLIGFGCTTCNGNSGPLAPEIEAAVREGQLVSVAVLSGNRNFEGRVHPHARAAYLASPPLVVAYAIAGSITRDLATEPLGCDRDGKPVYLRDIWPPAEEVAECVGTSLTPELYSTSYENLFEGAPEWQALRGGATPLFPWRADSTFLRKPPYFYGVPKEPAPIGDLKDMRPLAILGDMVTTDHLSPNNTIATDSPAARYLTERGVKSADFQTYGFRRGNHEMALRGTFASNRLKNEMVAGTEGPYTRLQPEGTVLPIFDAAATYRSRGVPLIVFAGREYGAGSSRDWAAKGPALLGVRAVVAEGFERIHRSNLVGVGILPLELKDAKRADLGLDGTEVFDVLGITDDMGPRAPLRLRIRRGNGAADEVPVASRVDTAEEFTYYRHGGILPYVYREMVSGRRPRENGSKRH